MIGYLDSCVFIFKYRMFEELIEHFLVGQKLRNSKEMLMNLLEKYTLMQSEEYASHKKMHQKQANSKL